MNKTLSAYSRLMRLDKPIGIYLVLWPAMWALWLASAQFPQWHLIVIFVLGTVAMRSAGCVINDFADRKVDGHVKRTQSRPMVTGDVSSREALILFVGLCLVGLLLVLFTNRLTLMLSLGAVGLTFVYPFMKRYTHWPQVVLGAAFAWSVPMGFAAQAEQVPLTVWGVYLAVLLWTVAYDTFYAMVDRKDDLKIGVKSTAILFDHWDRLITGGLQVTVLILLAGVGLSFHLGAIYFTALVFAAMLFVYQQYLIRYREEALCFRAFLNNHPVGFIIFAGIALDRWYFPLA